MRQNFLFNHRVYISIIPTMEDQLCICLSKDIEEYIISRCSSIKGTLYRNYSLVIILLIVGKNHQLRDIDESAKSFIPHSNINTFLLRHYPFRIIWFFHLNKSDGKTIYKTSYIWSKIIASLFIFTSKFGRYVPVVIVGVLIVNELYPAIRR